MRSLSGESSRWSRAISVFKDLICARATTPQTHATRANSVRNANAAPAVFSRRRSVLGVATSWARWRRQRRDVASIFVAKKLKKVLEDCSFGASALKPKLRGQDGGGS